MAKRWLRVPEHPGFLPGFLSFLLPGLGQLYQRRTTAAVGAFAAFAVALVVPALRGLVLPVAAAAGVEAFRRGGGKAEGDGRRRYFFCSAAVVAFCFWGMLVAPISRQLGLQAELNARAERLARAVNQCGRMLGNPPDTLSVCGEVPGARLTDPWGRPYRYQPDGRYFRLRSDGADGRPDTEDDLAYRFRFR